MKSFYSLFLVLLLTINITYPQTIIDTIEVKAGWNIIGALTTGNTIEIINTIPSGIISSSFFGYTPGVSYQTADTLHKGKGYWVNVIQDGAIIFLSSTDCGTVFYSGKTYSTIIIGNQCWLKENLDVGVGILGNQNQTNNGVIEKYCYNNNSINCNTYGGLYFWDEAMQYNTMTGAQGICPVGWHIPTESEFQELATEVNYIANSLLAEGQGGGTNTSGFSAFYAGARSSTSGGDFINLGTDTYFWSSSALSLPYPKYVYLASVMSGIYFSDTDYNTGFSVRCVKD